MSVAARETSFRAQFRCNESKGRLRVGARILFVLSAFAGLGVLPGAALPAHAGDVDDVLARAIAWRGGSGYAKLESLHVQGTLEASGLKGTVDTYSNAAGDSYEKADLGVVRQTQVVHGDAGWTSTPTGQIEALSPDAVNDARGESRLDFLPAIVAGRRETLHLMGDEIHDEKTWTVIHIDAKGKDGFDLFFDADTGAWHGYRRIQDNATSFVRESDWRIVDGVRMPFLIETISPNPGENATVTVTSIQLNSGIPSELFARPNGDSKITIAGGARRSNWVVFDFVDEDKIFIPVRVNGVPAKALLDSGAASTVLDKEFATAARVSSQGALPTTGTGGATTAGIAAGVEIQVGDVTMRDMTVAVLPMKKLTEQMGADLPVILGKEIFNDLVVDIDFEHRRIAFEQDDGFTPPAGATLLDLPLNKDGLRTFEISLEGAKPVRAWFDLGNSGSPLAIGASYWQPLDWEKTRPSTVAMSGGVGGMAVEHQMIVNSAQLGGFRFDAVPAILEPPGHTAFESERTVVNVGIEIWRRFHLITDYSRNRMMLAPIPDAMNVPFRKDRTGLALERDDLGLVVHAIADGSPAKKGDWRVGDRIVQINGVPATSPSAAEIWRAGKAGDSVGLRGESIEGASFERTLVLEDFY